MYRVYEYKFKIRLFWKIQSNSQPKKWKHSISCALSSPPPSHPSLSRSSSSSALSSPGKSLHAPSPPSPPPPQAQKPYLSMKARSGTSAAAPSTTPSGTQYATRFLTSTARVTRLRTTSPPTKLAKLPRPPDPCAARSLFSALSYFLGF